MKVRSYGFVTVLQIIGNWQEELGRLVGYNRPTPDVADAISAFILEHPLESKPGQNGHEELYLGDLSDNWMLFCTNRHWFPVAWIIRQLPRAVLLNVADGAVLTHKALATFYANGLKHYKNGIAVASESVRPERFSGVLPTNYKAIESPMPDRLLEKFYPEHR